jgi:hypothetical protein
VYSSGSLDNIQVGAGGPVPGRGSVVISGNEQSAQICTHHLAGGDCETYRTAYDSGTVSITVNGIYVSTSYGEGSTASTIASALVTAINSTPSTLVSASANGTAVLLTATTTGAGTNYTLSSTSSTSQNSTFGGPSFSAISSGTTLTGGAATSDLGDILTSVLVDGSASMTLDESTCPYPEYDNLLNELPTATHTPSAYNVVNGVGGWGTGTSECVTCYLSTQLNEDSGPVSVGVPVAFTSGGEVDCSVGGIIWNPIITGNAPGCIVPSTETTDDEGFNGASFRERFEMTISDSNADSFDGYYVQEVTAAPGSNSCYWAGSGLPQNPGVQGSQWSVGTVAGTPEHNHWGFDSIGWNLADLDNIVQNGPAHGVTFPCVTTIHQGMQIMCNANTYWQYRTDDITITVENDPNSEVACRDDECGIPASFSDRWTGIRFEWARILKSANTFSLVTRTAKEAR